MLRQVFSIKMLAYVVGAVLFAVVLPIGAASLNWTDVQQYQYLLFGANVVYTVIIGFWAGRKHHGWFFILLFPLVFVLAASFFYADIARYFAVVYLLLTLLAYGTTR